MRGRADCLRRHPLSACLDESLDALDGFRVRLGPLPCLAELASVTEPEDPAHEEEDCLIQRPRNGGEPKRPAPADRSRDPPVLTTILPARIMRATKERADPTRARVAPD